MSGSNRGQATLEAAGTMCVLFAFLIGMLLVAYLLFARAWIQFQSEQALYCLAESKPAWSCRKKFVSQVAAFLPFGKIDEDHIELGSSGDQWRMRMQWNFHGYVVRADKHLSTKIIVGSRALR